MKNFCKIEAATGGVLKKFAKCTGKHLCQSLFFNKNRRPQDLQLFKKRDSGTVFSRQFCEMFKNTFSNRTPPVTVSDKKKYIVTKP